jgi:tetratricopeptide (TPR) repeat protein
MIRKQLGAALLLALSLVSAARAQRVRVHDVPPRPSLWAGADTNSANAYYLTGLQNVERNPLMAAAAFYWAERLQPGWADALYGRRMALLMSEPTRLVDYIEGKGYVLRNPEVLAIDSLVLRANQRSPFLFTVLEKPFWMMYFRSVYAEAIRRETGSADNAAAEYLMQNAMGDADPGMRAWLDFSAGHFPAAADGYERALRRSPRSSSLNLALGRARYLAGDYARAAEAIAQAIAQRREGDRREIVHLYESKAMLEFSRAHALEQAGDTAAAREAFGRTLQEDLSFWPAHRRLSQRALQHGDTATAVAELALAVELAPEEADLRYDHATLLLQSGQLDPAVAELRKAIELDPYFATPHYLMALLNDQSQVVPDAVDHYRHFLSLAPRDDARRAGAEQRLAALSAPAPAAP